MSNLNRKIALIATNIFIFLTLLVVAELLTRVFYPEIILTGTSGNLIETNKFGESHGLKPNSEGTSHGVVKKVNERGFWKYGKDKKNVAGKILFLGDSITMGIGVESDSSFAGIIYKSLDSYEVLNTSLIAYTSIDYLNIASSLLRNQEYRESIDRIYLFWCLNDVYPRHILNDAPGIIGDDLISSLVGLLRENSKLYHLLKHTFSDRSKSYFLYDRQFYADNNPDFIRSMDNIRTIYQLTKEYDIEFDLYLLPYEYQIRNVSNADFVPQQLITKNLSDLNIKIHDCSKAFQNFHDDSQYLYLYGDGIHFSTTGHKLLAKYILKPDE